MITQKDAVIKLKQKFNGNIKSVSNQAIKDALAEYGFTDIENVQYWRTLIQNAINGKKSRPSRAPLYRGKTTRQKQKDACNRALAVAAERHNDRLAGTNVLDVEPAPEMDEIADMRFGPVIMTEAEQEQRQSDWEARHPDFDCGVTR